MGIGCLDVTDEATSQYWEPADPNLRDAKASFFDRGNLVLGERRVKSEECRQLPCRSLFLGLRGGRRIHSYLGEQIWHRHEGTNVVRQKYCAACCA